MEGHTGLRVLAVPGAPVDDLAPVAALTCLEELDLEGCRRIAALDALSGLTALRALRIGECGRIASLAPLRATRRLEVLDAHGSTAVADRDLTPLLDLPRLRELRMADRRGCSPRVADVQAAIADAHRAPG